jgi:glyoxylase-like metal-dependent hydrolase (beta-lactamase superfamily II)
MFIRQFQLEGLGHLSTLIGDEEAGVAAVIDPRRDVDIYVEAARERGLRISQVIETHLHNDYVSGGRELAAATGAEQVIGAAADLAFEHRPVRHGEVAVVGALKFRVLDTPGHTPEHVAYSVADTSRADEPLLMFTGGSLLVGAVGRTDLLGAANAWPYAELMFHSLHDSILTHQDFVGIFPTHGAGSLCSTGIGSTLNSTIGFERRYNPLLQPTEVDAFARALLAGQPAVPRYFARMRSVNQAGPRVLGGIPAPVPVSIGELGRCGSAFPSSLRRWSAQMARRRSWWMSARPANMRRVTSPVPGTSAPATSPGAWPTCPTIARSPQSAAPATGPASPPRSSTPLVSPMSAGSTTAWKPGPRAASRSNAGWTGPLQSRHSPPSAATRTADRRRFLVQPASDEYFRHPPDPNLSISCTRRRLSTRFGPPSRNPASDAGSDRGSARTWSVVFV